MEQHCFLLPRSKHKYGRNMIVSNQFLKRALLHPGGIYSAFIKNHASSVAFGDPRMPDKLYKSIGLEIKSCERAVMRSYENFIKMAAQHLDIGVEKVVSSKKPDFDKFTLLKSVFVHRKHLVQYEVRTYYTWVYLSNLTGSTADTFLEYIERMLPEGVALKVTRVALEPLPAHLNSKSIKESTESSL